MAYRMKMFKSQKPSSFDLRVSDFKRIPGFNYVLSVSTEDEHTYNSLAQVFPGHNSPTAQLPHSADVHTSTPTAPRPRPVLCVLDLSCFSARFYVASPYHALTPLDAGVRRAPLPRARVLFLPMASFKTIIT